MDFALIWARLSIGLEVQLTRASDGRLLWKARHTASRSQGGITLSPLGAATHMVEAAALTSDADQATSLVADLTRRIVATLPPKNRVFKEAGKSSNAKVNGSGKKPNPFD